MMNSSIFQDRSISTTEKCKTSIAEAPNFTLEFNDQVVDIELSPYLLSHDLISIALPQKIVVGQIKFQEENNCQIEDVCFIKIEEFRVEERVLAMCFSPESNIKIAPKSVILAYTNSQNQLVICASDFAFSENRFRTKVINSHNGYINGIAYEKEGNLLASCSDDLTCRIWLANNSYDPLCKFYLSSPGMAVSWHKEDSAKLLIGEKSGVITLYNVSTRQTILSLRSQGSPLISMDWCPTNYSYISAMCGGNLVVWSINNPSAPLLERTVHPEGGAKVKFFPLHDTKMLTLGAHDNTLKIHQTNPPGFYPTALTSTLKMCSGLTCHHHLPYVCASSDNSIFIWKLPV